MDKYANYDASKIFIYPTPLYYINDAPYYNLGDIPQDETSGHCILSIGNSGTSMMIKALAYLSGGPVHASHSQYKVHTNFLMSNTNIKVIVIVRDPRDYILSRMGIRDQKIDLNIPLSNYEGWGAESAFQTQAEFEEFLPSFLTLPALSRIKLQLNDKYMPPFGNAAVLYKTLMQFTTRPNTLFIRFEDMLNLDKLKTGNSVREQTLIEIGNFLELPLNDAIIAKTADELIGNTVNFNPNLDKTGYWKIHFTPEIVELFKTTYMQDILIKFKYEQDASWDLDKETKALAESSPITQAFRNYTQHNKIPISDLPTSSLNEHKSKGLQLSNVGDNEVLNCTI